MQIRRFHVVNLRQEKKTMLTEGKYSSGPACKKCKEIMDRTKRTSSDHFFNILTFNLFEFKRFKCSGCLTTKLLAKSHYRKNQSFLSEL
jgi:hypothetical protein